jgi:hypothetical protein
MQDHTIWFDVRNSNTEQTDRDVYRSDIPAYFYNSAVCSFDRCMSPRPKVSYIYGNKLTRSESHLHM